MSTEMTTPRKGNRHGALSTGRPIIFGGPSYKSRRYERNAFDYRFKLDVINHVALNGITAAMQKYFPDITSGKARKSRMKIINDWVKQRTKIEEVGYSSSYLVKKVRNKGVGTSLSKETEENLVQWIKDMRDEGIPVANLMLQLKAKQIAEEQGYSGEQFKGSRQWADGFKKRHGFSLRMKTRQGQDKEEGANEEKVRFSELVRQVYKMLIIFLYCLVDYDRA
jgi:hypothetical protein